MITNRAWMLRFGVVLLAVLFYLSSGLYSLQSGQRALVLRFGRVVYEVAESGVHYHLPVPIERIVKVHVSEVQTLPVQVLTAKLPERFTGDENLIAVRALISYDIKALNHYLFTIREVPLLIQTVGQTCLTQELAAMSVDDVMTGGKSVLRLVIKKNIQLMLDDLNTGVRVISVELTEMIPPPDVAYAFKAVSDARIQKQQIIKDAEGYANEIIPEARGQASSIIAQAEAYAQEVLHRVNGRTKAFNDLLVEYQQSPEITTKLQYLNTIQAIFQRSRLMIDSDSSHSIYYIDQSPEN